MTLKSNSVFAPLLMGLQQLWSWIAMPPYRGVPVVVWIYAVLACTFYTQNGPMSGHLFGFDDHVRMTQVLNWINGAGWYDRTIMRANPPEGFHTLWTRIVDIPIAAVVLVAQQFVDQRTAALIASIVVPNVELAILFIVARYFARPLVGKKEAWLVILFVMFTSILNFKYTFAGFHPGEASHHSWYAILDVLMFGAATRVIIGVPGRSPQFLLALAIGLLLAVGIEGFILMAGVAVIISLLAWWYGHPQMAFRAAQGYGLGALLGLLLLPMNQPFENLFDISFAEPSIIGPILLATAAIYLAVEGLILKSVDRKDKITSVIAMLVIASILGGLLVMAFPQMLDGPAAALSPQERQLAFKEHTEAYPLYKVARDKVDGFCLLMPIIIGFIAGIVGVKKAKSPRRRIMRFAYFGFALMCGLIPQMIWRYYHYALLTACTWLLWAWQKIRQALPKNRNYGLLAFVSFVALGPFFMLLLPAFNNNDTVTSRVLFYPAALHSTEDPCDVLALSNYINHHYPPSTILSVPAWDSSRFLYYTDVVLDFVANYPSHNKFIDNKRIFESRDQDEARRIILRHNIGLIAVCRVPLFLNAHYPLEDQLLIALLQAKLAPPWLKLVDTGMDINYLLYAVDRDQAEKMTGLR
jgi:hypothetical protein